MSPHLTDIAEEAFWSVEGNTRQALENVTRVLSERFKETIISISVENERLKAKLAEREAEYA
ncbi:RNase H-fold protein (predicted Holliday junction resolvase) [Paenochrobactrum gallinarii]|uniref:RNase H-fold protein (Predicted Holliday junction resolvase) n=1 Tax=Paenochrobactrum gallinarii TaxID=643673 RepID=A0A841LXP7_9HYPH|nr:hypothetical protein [Paenochrobactrum gallinarii]MBB6262126.1 RNase H-fold protein (predicted Holliday junction resolvase) [Paenochrobactrum gallinarii]